MFAAKRTDIPTYLLVVCWQGKYEEADPLCLRAIVIDERALGPDHPELAAKLSKRAGLLQQQVGEGRQHLGGGAMRLLVTVMMRYSATGVTQLVVAVQPSESL